MIFIKQLSGYWLLLWTDIWIVKDRIWEKTSEVQTFVLLYHIRIYIFPAKLLAMATLKLAHVHLYTLIAWLIIWASSSKLKAVLLLAASVSFLSPAMLNPSRNSDRNNTSTHYKAIIQFWRLSIANQGESNIHKKLFKKCVNLQSFS